MKQVHLVISGYVQGIGYRYFVKTTAVRLSISGWVRNIKGNQVEAVFQGQPTAIEEMIAYCRKGPFLAEVKDVIVTWEEADTIYGGFEIHPTS